jgi:spectinomycin phosphotransferase
MRDRPAGLGERKLSKALADGWQLQVADAQYAPVGGGSYHWIVRDTEDRRWFATVDDLDVKRWLGEDRATVADGLQAAMDVAVALRHRHSLRFVLAPTTGRNGLTVRRLGDNYAVSMFPYVDGVSGHFGEDMAEGDKDELVGMLAALHACPLAALPVRRARVALPRRGDLEAALDDLGHPWSGGPFSDQARALLAGSAGQIRRLLATFDILSDHVRTLEPVVTHGEPHPANLMRTDSETMLIDWDTVGAAPPERDLWWLVSDSSGGTARGYAAATGRTVDREALAFYRLRWALDDLSIFACDLRAAHRRTADTEHAWQALKITVAGLLD